MQFQKLKITAYSNGVQSVYAKYNYRNVKLFVTS